MDLKAINLIDLTKTNKPEFNQRGNNCTVYMIDYESSGENLRYLFLVKCKESYSNGTGHIVSMLFDKGSSKYNKPLSDDVRVHCQCPAFIYWGAAYNSTNPVNGDSYNLDFAENRTPDVRDPNREVKVCKHISKVRNKLRNITYKMLDKKAGIKASSLNTGFSLLPIEETFSSIHTYLERFKKDINPIEFTNSLTKMNFESKLLEVGLII